MPQRVKEEGDGGLRREGKHFLMPFSPGTHPPAAAGCKRGTRAKGTGNARLGFAFPVRDLSTWVGGRWRPGAGDPGSGLGSAALPSGLDHSGPPPVSPSAGSRGLSPLGSQPPPPPPQAPPPSVAQSRAAVSLLRAGLPGRHAPAGHSRRRRRRRWTPTRRPPELSPEGRAAENTDLGARDTNSSPSPCGLAVGAAPGGCSSQGFLESETRVRPRSG